MLPGRSFSTDPWVASSTTLALPTGSANSINQTTAWVQDAVPAVATH